MSSEVEALKAFFTSIQVHVSDLWLTSCINWCKTETLGANYTQKELQSKVYEQWLVLDLRDIEVSALPPNLSTKTLFTLNGNYCLQMMQIVDISKPKLWQLQKIRNSNHLTRNQKDSEEVGTGKRLLQLTLTDGVQEVEAMEYKPISCLSLNLIPGIKVRIMGPVVVRRGRLMLEPHNLKILGGQVEELLVSNAAENVLARHLKLPENPNPRNIEEKLFVVDKDETNEGYVSINNFKVPPNKSTHNKYENTNHKSAQNKPTQSKPVRISDEIPDDDLLFNDIDELIAAEDEAKSSNFANRKSPNIFEDYIGENDFRDFNQSSTSTQVQQNKNELSLDDGNDDIFNEIDISPHLDKADKNVTTTNNPLNPPNILTIAKLLEKKINVSKGVFRIRAKFKGIEEKLTVADNEYKLVIKIEDSTGELTAKVDSGVVSSFAACTPEEMMDLKESMLGTNKEAGDKIMKALTRVKEKLLLLDDTMMVKIEKDKLPVITKIL